MNPDTLRLILQVTGVVVGGGILEFARRMLARRAELRNLNARSDATLGSSYKELVDKLQEDSAVYREQAKTLQARIDLVEQRYEQAQRLFNQQLQDAHAENTRLTTRIAQLQTDLDIAARQVNELRNRLGRL